MPISPLFSTWQDFLTDLAEKGRLLEATKEAFSLEEIPDTLTSLIQQWQTGDFSHLPAVELLSNESLSGAMGAYASSGETIYLNEDWLSTASEEDALAVLMEELGHHLDNVVKERDSIGDEGARFASLVQGNELSESELASLLKEDDRASLEIGGETVRVEQAEFTVTTASDSGEGSLRQAIVQANETAGADVITFDSNLSGETISLTSGQLEITDALTINGLGSDELIISGNENSRIFQIDDSNDQTEIEVAINGLTLKEGEVAL